MNIHSAVIATALGCALTVTSTLSAQVAGASDTSKKASHWELLIPSGTMVPTGAQRSAIKRGNLTALQLAYVALPGLAVTSTIGWVRSRDIATAGDPKLDVFTYDVGAELRGRRWLADKPITFRPFVGAGAGGRSYDYRKLDVQATHNVAVYGSVGTDVGISRAHVRLEARDYATGFKPLSGEGTARTGNDVVLMVGLRFGAR